MNDYDMILMLNKGLYGGTSFVGHQFSRSNIPGTFSYNPQEEEKTDLMFDVSNLYGMIDKLFSISLLFFIYKYFSGWSMSKPMPIGDFRWEDPSNFDTKDKIDRLKCDGDRGYFLMVL